jgi:hypothetical protein
MEDALGSASGGARWFGCRLGGIFVRAFDGIAWGNWDQFTLTTT